MTPVISPWVFYLMYVGNNVSFISAVVFIIALIAVGVFGLAFLLSIDDDYINVPVRKMLKLCFITVIISGLITTVVPDESTITKMSVAQNVTYERVDVATDVVETVYNDIMNLFEEADNDD